jgi:hypothetical protein
LHRATRYLAAAFVPLAAPGAAAPDMVQTELGRYKCDTPAGHYAQHTIVPLQVGKEMRVAFRLNADHYSEKWPALAVVYFEGPQGKSRVAVGKASNDRFQMYVAVGAPGTETDDAVFAYPLTKDWIILKLTLDKYGYLTVRANDMTRKYKLGQVTRTYLHCNSGDWDIDVWPRSYVVTEQ